MPSPSLTMQEAIEARRKELGMKKQQMAWALRITPDLYSHFLAGRRRLSHRSRAIAFHKFGVPAVTLLPAEEMK